MSNEKKNPETLPSQGYFGGGHGIRFSKAPGMTVFGEEYKTRTE